jgi:hydroxymethylbilane synthase
MEESNKKITIATRGSDLALWQAHFLQSELRKVGVESKLLVLKTKGDIIQHLSFDKIEGKGFFTKEIEDALINYEADIAVHSMKDLPTASPEGLVVGAVSYRENPRDALLIRKECIDESQILKFKANAIVGTSSARRKAQIAFLRSDSIVKDIRGNVPGRVNKLRNGDYDAILLAAAGIERLKLDLGDLEVIHLHPREFVPAPAQGVLAFQCRSEDKAIRKILKLIHNEEVARCTNVERGVLSMMDGGCHMPLGVYCEKDKLGNYHLHAAMASELGKPLIKINISQSTTDQLKETAFNMLKEKQV